MSSDRLLRRKEVESEVGLSCATIYRMMARDAFPRPRRVGLQAVRWRESEIAAWKANQPIADRSSARH